MPSKKKKFIDKKKALRFHLVHRSQRDPLVTDETAPEHVLLETSFKDSQPADQEQKRKAEQQKYGIYFDDDYNYLQHLKDVSSVVDWEPLPERGSETTANATIGEALGSSTYRLQLPSSVFASVIEEDEGVLNRAAPHPGPRPDWDPDIVAALEGECSSLEELEDDFITLANDPKGGLSFSPEVTSFRNETNDVSESDDSDNNSDWSEEEEGALGLSDEETKSRFTNYSLTSSVIPRSECLQVLDDRFEKVFESYDDEEIGALDGEEIAGYLNPNDEILTRLAEEFTEKSRLPTLKDITCQAASRLVKEEKLSQEEVVTMEFPEPAEDQWDCESILSTYSNKYNHPKLIVEPSKPPPVRISHKTGLPLDVSLHKGLTKNQLKQFDNTEFKPGAGSQVGSRLSVASTARAKNETPEERHARKAAVKEMRRERRMEKKANKLAFKEEHKRQELAMLNLRNLQGIKLT